MDSLAGEAQTLGREFPEAKEDPAYANCLYWHIESHWKRRHKSQFVKALEMYSQINFEGAANRSNAAMVSRDISIISYCFDL